MAAQDVAGTAALCREMQAHYRVPCPPLDEIVARLSRLPEGVSLLVAASPAVVGFAALGAIYPGPGLKPGFFLKELFVSAEARGRGVGTALMRAAARLAVERGFARLDWTADRGDERLIRYYEALGGAQQTGKVFFRLSGQALVDLASGQINGRAEAGP